MRYTRNASGLERIRTSRYKKKIPHSSLPRREKIINEDTIIRKDIYNNIIEMIRNNENNITIECVLREKYPQYAEYIAKVVNDQFIKYKLHRKVKTEDIEINDGDER